MVHNGALVQKKTLQKLAGMSNERAAAPPSAFASDFLKRLGWQEGDGLGKDRGGRTSHVRVAMKDDVRGIGCKDESKEDFAGAWWSSGFDDALSKLQVATGNDDDDSDSSDSDSEHELEEDAKISIQLRDMSTYSEADRKLFIACGGRRPGQRAGRLQTGKIIREHLADKSFKAKLASIDPSKAREEFHKIAQTTIVTMKKAGADVKEIDTEAVEAAVAAAAEAIAEDTKKDKIKKKKEKTKTKKDKTEKKEKTKKKRTRAEALEDESQDESEKEMKKKAKKKAKKEKKEKSGKTEKKEKKEKKEKRKAKKVKGAAAADA